MYYKDNECSYQNKYCCLPPINVNVTCTGGGGDEDTCCCSKVSMREALNYLLTPQINQYINRTAFFGIKQISNNADIILVSNDLVRVDGNPDADISICSIYVVNITANNSTDAAALEAAIRGNPLYSGDVTVPDEPCCCKKEIIDRLVAARAANTTITLDTESVASANITAKVIGIAPDIAWLRGVTGANPNNDFYLVSICRIAAFVL